MEKGEEKRARGGSGVKQPRRGRCAAGLMLNIGQGGQLCQEGAHRIGRGIGLRAGAYARIAVR